MRGSPRATRLRRFVPQAGFAVGALLLTGVGASTVQSAPQHGETLGFAVTWFAPAANEGVNDCLEGVTTKIDAKAFLQRIPAAMRPAYEVKEGARMWELAVARGPHGEDVCEDPAHSKDPGFKTVTTKIAPGVNLSAKNPGNTCKHEQFEASPLGEKNVDNQLYRVEGCVAGLRGRTGFLYQFRNTEMWGGDMTILIELTGVDDRLNDDEIEVGIHTGGDPLVKDAVGKSIVRNTSLSVGDVKEFKNRVRGKIVDGMVITEAQTIRFKSDRSWGPEYFFRDGRLNLKLMPNGDLNGVIGGYMDTAQFWVGSGHWTAEQYANLSCDGRYHALKRYADGYPDPKTGECTAISTAWQIDAVPAFVIHDAKVSEAAPAPDKTIKVSSAN